MPANSEMQLSDRQLSDEQSRAVAIRVREELARRRISRQHLADQAKISISTLEKALSGRRPFTLATTIRLEEALGVALRKANADGAPAAPPVVSLAPGELGFYSRPAVSFIEATYLTLRPSFGDPAAIYAYRTEICWDAGTSSLIFRESERLDANFAQQGLVSVPNESGYGEMFGIMTTLQVGRGNRLMPVTAPIAYVSLKRLADVEFGRITPDHPSYEGYRNYLKRTIEELFALFLQV
jgi:transcriptional regulator with XRE-family HTH domain